MSDSSARSETETTLNRPDAAALLDEITNRLRRAAEDVVPWFATQMPDAYFQDTDPTTRLSQLTAIIGARASGAPLALTLNSADGAIWTFIHEGSYPGVLARLLGQLPKGRPLAAAKVHTTADSALALDVFRFRDAIGRFDPADPIQLAKRDQTLQLAREQGETDLEGLRRHLESCDPDYLRSVRAPRMIHNWRMCERARQAADDTLVELEEPVPGYRRFNVATTDVRARSLFERVVTHLARYQLDIHRAYLDMFEHDGSSVVAVLGFVVHETDFLAAAPDHPRWRELAQELSRLKWVDSQALALLAVRPEMGLVRAEVAVALCRLVHAILGREDSHAFSRVRLFMLLEQYLDIVVQIADLLLARLRPQEALTEAACAARATEIEQQIGRAASGDQHSQRFLEYLLAAVRASLRSNVFVERRYALAIRLDPQLLVSPQQPEAPYGVFFVHGRGFDGFHVRFRDIARGGVRVVRTLGPGEYGREAVRIYDEAYQLAYAQQLKNKDIPEGGSKAVLLVEPSVPVEPTVKAFADSLLDLLSPDPRLRANIVDLFGREEFLYLGPDENISNDLIEWIVDRASKRGYAMPGAFMSSKPGAGINHKAYGVTSEGVTVFLEEVLRSIGIDPRQQRFTVKLTGGPDGDVAGNEIRILQREFGSNAQIVGIADGSGMAEDPDGLNQAELLRLVERSAPIAEFDVRHLGPRGRVVKLDDPDGRRLRNTLHNRLKADAFIPAGGRPATIDETNWRDYLHADGPSSRVIVEGANLFITPEARRQLSQAGVLIVKDSSANKCGVICSSLEIVASMLLSPSEFLAHKETFVREVLERLRQLARREARLLLREHRLDPHVPLPEVSIRVSREILRVRDSIERALPSLSADDRALLRSLVDEHLPPSVLQQGADRVDERMPPVYLEGIMAASLATRIVYREGLGYLAGIPAEQLPAVALGYLRTERETHALVSELATSDLVHRERIIALLQQGGPRAGLAIADEARETGGA